jgi:putative transposase
MVLRHRAEGRDLRPPPGRDARRPGGGRAPPAAAGGGDPRLPVGQDDRTGGPRGDDACQNVNGRKRQILVDTLGLLRAVVVHAADIQDPEGATLVLESIRGRFRRLKLIGADGIDHRIADGVARWRRAWPIRLEVVARSEPGLTILKRRWVMERTWAWLGRWRRLSKDYEATPSSGEAFVKLAMIDLTARRLVKRLKR